MTAMALATVLLAGNMPVTTPVAAESPTLKVLAESIGSVSLATMVDNSVSVKMHDTDTEETSVGVQTVEGSFCYTFPGETTETELLCETTLYSDGKIAIDVQNTKRKVSSVSDKFPLFRITYDRTLYTLGFSPELAEDSDRFVDETGNNFLDFYLEVDKGEAVNAGTLFTVYLFPRQDAGFPADRAEETEISMNDTVFRAGNSENVDFLFLEKEEKLEKYDVNGDTNIDAADAAEILVISAKLGAGMTEEDIAAVHNS